MPKFALETFRDIQSLDTLKKNMKTSLVEQAGKGQFSFVAAKNYKTQKGALNVFLVVNNNEVTKFKELVESRGGTVGTGTAILLKENVDGKPVSKLIVKTSVGGLDPGKSAGIAKLAIGVGSDPKWIVRSEDEEEQANKPKGIDVARRSREQYNEAQTNEADKVPQIPSDFAEKVAKVVRETGEYGKFAAAYEDLAKKYGLDEYSDYKAVPVTIWSDMIDSMAKSEYFTKNIPKVNGDPNKLIFAMKGEDGQVIREKMLAKAMKGMTTFINHAENNLMKVRNEVLANRSHTWSFWSGVGAKEAALAEAGDGVVLEGSVGAWYEKVWRFEHLTGVNDMLLWNSLSELYAKVAAESYKKFKFRGYIGPGGSRDTTVWNNIEQPTMIQVLNVQKQVPIPPFTWYVTDCVRDTVAPSGWAWTKGTSKAFTSRDAAVEEVKRRYGQ